MEQEKEREEDDDKVEDEEALQDAIEPRQPLLKRLRYEYMRGESSVVGRPRLAIRHTLSVVLSTYTAAQRPVPPAWERADVPFVRPRYYRGNALLVLLSH